MKIQSTCCPRTDSDILAYGTVPLSLGYGMVEPPPEAAPALEAAPAAPPALEAALEVAPAAAPAAAAAPTPTPTLIPTPTRTPDEAMPADLARAPEPAEAPMPAPSADLTPDAPAPDGRGASGAPPAAAEAPAPAPEAAPASAPKKFFTLRAPTLAEAARTKGGEIKGGRESESRVCVLFCVVSRREVSARAPSTQHPPPGDRRQGIMESYAMPGITRLLDNQRRESRGNNGKNHADLPPPGRNHRNHEGESGA